MQRENRLVKKNIARNDDAMSSECIDSPCGEENNQEKSKLWCAFMGHGGSSVEIVKTTKNTKRPCSQGVCYGGTNMERGR
jgi:hypothetical protein